MPGRPINIEFPVAGLDESAPHQSQPPYTTPEALNVRPRDTLSGRARGGGRPGLRLAYNYHTSTDYGSFGAPVRCIAEVDYVDTNNLDEWSDDFEGNALGESWEGIETLGSADDRPFPALFSGGLCYNTTSTLQAAATSTPAIDYDDSYSVWIDIVPWKGEFSGTYRLYAGLQSATPDEDYGVVCEFTLNANGGYSGFLRRYYAGAIAGAGAQTVTFTSTTDGPICPGRLVLYHVGAAVAANGRYELQWQDQYVVGATSPVERAAFSNMYGVGFGLRYDGSATDGRACVSQFGARFYSTTNVRVLQRHQVAIANSKLFYSSARVGALVEHATAVSSVAPISAVSWGQFLYVANGGNIIGQGTGRIYDPGPPGAYMDADAAVDFSAAPYNIDENTVNEGAGYDPPVYVLEIVQANKGIRLGTYRIVGWWNTNDKLLFTGYLGYTVDAAGIPCKWRIIERPIIYNPNASPSPAIAYWYARTQETSSPVTYKYDKGEVPCGCRIIARYFDRVWMAGSPEHLGFASRLGDPFDWNFAQTDSGRAYSIQTSDAGAIGERVTALVPFGEDYMVIGCVDSLWRIVGDMPNGGYITNISRAVGVATQSSWCRTPEGYLLFVSRDGIYALSPGSGSLPAPIGTQIPAQLKYCIQNGSRLSMAWDQRSNGAWIFHTQDNVTKRAHWWFDWSSKRFWPVALPDGFAPTAISTDEIGRVMLGGRDGTMRMFDEHAGNDCGLDIDSYVKIGPFRSGDARRRVRVANLRGTLGNDSGPVEWSLHVSPTGENVLAADPFQSGLWDSGQNHTTDPRAGGGAVVLRLSGGNANYPIEDSNDLPIQDSNGDSLTEGGQLQPWAVEEITATLSDGGELRV